MKEFAGTGPLSDRARHESRCAGGPIPPGSPRSRSSHEPDRWRNESLVPLPYDINLSILFTELPLLERPDAASRAGFDAVEFWWPFPVAVPSDVEVDNFVSAVTDSGVQLVGLNFFAGDMAGGDRGVTSWPARSAEFRDNVDVAVGIGARLGCRAFNALYGRRIDGTDPAEQDDLAVSNLAIAGKAAGEIDGHVLIEPVSGAVGYPLLTAKDAVGVIDRVFAETRVDNLRLLCDLYHLSVNGDDLDQVITMYADRIGHVQIADAPGRHEPGTGELELERYLSLLDAGGYRGWVGLEYKPESSTEQSLHWLPRGRRQSRT